jgi:two-component system chemotaxis response regulator CheB
VKPVRVLLVDDSPLVLAVLTRILAADPEIEVVGTAKNGQEALALIPKADPNVICTDFYMPVMNGLEFTRRVMAEHPRPILVVSVAVGESQPENVFQLLEAGAVDVFPKPRGGFAAENEALAQELRNRVKVLSRVHVFRKLALPTSAPLPAMKPAGLAVPHVVAMGASAGGPQALATVLSGLPEDFPAPILCVQHVSEGFLDGLVSWLGSHTRLQVRIAQQGEQPLPGRVYFSQEEHHLLVGDGGRLVLSDDPARVGHRPSVDLLFESVARRYGAAAVAVLLSGMGADGAAGMAEVAKAGGMTIAQDEATSVIFGMPGEAVRLGAARRVLPVDQIARVLRALCEVPGAGREPACR